MYDLWRQADAGPGSHGGYSVCVYQHVRGYAAFNFWRNGQKKSGLNN